MTDYRPPLTDINFVLNHVAGLPSIAEFEAYPYADPGVRCRGPRRGGPLRRRGHRPPERVR